MRDEDKSYKFRYSFERFKYKLDKKLEFCDFAKIALFRGGG